MKHEDARMMLGARRDGELHDASQLDAHLASCQECLAFDTGMARIGAMAKLLPATPLPDQFEERVIAAVDRDRVVIGGPRRVGRRRLASVVAVAAIVVLLIVAGLPVRTFRVTAADAAASLMRLTSLDVTRTIDERGFDDGESTRVVERIRWVAPASTRIDRMIIGPGKSRVDETIIRLPGREYRSTGTARTLTTNLPPDPNPVPEPVSPTIALLGRSAGVGPMIAGRPTRRVVLESPGGVTRTAFVDASSSAALQSELNVVLGKVVLSKETTNPTRSVTKRVTSISYNPQIALDVFAIPKIAATDGGFRSAKVGSLTAAPHSAPAGFTLVRAGKRGDADWLQYAKRGFTITVRVGSTDPLDRDEATVELPARAGFIDAQVLVGLYDLPALHFVRGARSYLISAPMTVAQLEATANAMFPESRE